MTGIYVYMIAAYTVIEKSTFQGFSNINEGQPRFIICANLVGHTSQLPMPLEKKIFKGFLPYMGKAAIIDM